jgi:ATP-dependent helicase/nuclease subunit A
VLWDGKGQWDTRPEKPAWRMERDGRGWIMNLNGLTWEEPGGLGLQDTVRDYLLGERRRVIYVAATRARDLLVIPRAGDVRPGKVVCADLLAGGDRALDPALVRELEPYVAGLGSPWARGVGGTAQPAPGDAGDLDAEVSRRWTEAAAESGRPRFRPASVSGEAEAVARDEAAGEGGLVARKPREGRFGSLFGSTVHEAIGLMLRNGALTAREAVGRAAARFGFAEHVDEAEADVARALDALGKHQEATSLLQEVIKRWPDWVLARELLAKIPDQATE